MRWLLLASLFVSVSARKQILLTTTNSLMIKGPINGKTATEFIYDLSKRKSKDSLYVYIDTPGGSVEEGNKIVSEMLKHNVSCVAERAYSMGFILLQACHKRYITEFGRLMQHQISYGVADEKAKIESYVKFVEQIENKLTRLQSGRINISENEFSRRTYNDWWLVGENAVAENCADELADVTCSPKLTRENVTRSTMFFTAVYSKCPLVSGHIAMEPI